MPSSPPFSFGKTVLLLLLGAVLFHACGTATLPLLDRDEPRFAEAAREMQARGDFLVPYFNNQYRFDKPPLIYWCQNAVVAVMGESDRAMRLPSAVAAALTALVLLGFGCRVSGLRVGLAAALIYSTALQVMIHAKLAVADGLLVLFVALGFWAGWELLRTDAPVEDAKPPDRRFWRVVFCLALGFGFLAKGPVAWLPWMAVPLFCCWQRDPARAPVARWWLMALILAVLLVAAWGGPALWLTQGAYFKVGIGRHVVQRSLGVLEGHGSSHWLGYLASLPLYFVTVFPSFFPWSIWLPGLLRGVRRTGCDPLEKWLLSGTAITFVVFSFIRTKLPHYTLPAFPLLSLWVAWRWERTSTRPRRFAGAVAGMVALNLALSFLVFPVARRWSPSVSIASQVEPWLQPGTAIGCCDYYEPSLTWYFRRRTDQFMEELAVEDVAKFMSRPGPRVCVLTQAATDKLPPAPRGTETRAAEGYNVANGRRVRLIAWIKPVER